MFHEAKINRIFFKEQKPRDGCLDVYSASMGKPSFSVSSVHKRNHPLVWFVIDYIIKSDSRDLKNYIRTLISVCNLTSFANQ